MNVKKTGRLLSLLAGTAAISMTAAHAGVSSPMKPNTAKPAAAPATIIVKIGDAVLEEYHNGDPSSRATRVRGTEVAQKSKSADGGKKHS